jgi:hypothetical protein
MDRQCLEAAHADPHVADRPGIGQRDDADRHGSPAPPRRGRRHHRQADPAFHHPTDRLESGETNAQLQAATGARRVIAEVLLQCAADGGTNVVVLQSLAKGDPAMPGQPVLDGRDQDQAVFRERERLQFRSGIDSVSDNAAIG